MPFWETQRLKNALIKKYIRVVRALAGPYFLAGGDSEDLIQKECWVLYLLLGIITRLSALRSEHIRSYA